MQDFIKKVKEIIEDDITTYTIFIQFKNELDLPEVEIPLTMAKIHSIVDFFNEENPIVENYRIVKKTRQ